MSKQIDIGIVGATSLVGEALLELLSEQNFPIGKLYLLDSEDEAGGRIEFNKEQLRVEDVASFDFARVQLAFFVSSTSVSKDFVPKAAEAGCRVIDRTPAFRSLEQIPLIADGVNNELIKDNRIITNPCCIALCLTKVLKPVYDNAGIKSINITSLQAVSGAGREGLEEIGLQTAALLNFKEMKTRVFPHQMAFNVIPQIGAFTESGYTEEEMKVINETRKILNDDGIFVNVTTVRVPVFYGHSATVSVETKQGVSVEQIKSMIGSIAGVEISDDEDFKEYPTPVTDAAGQETTYIGRVRQQAGSEHHFEFWLTADNIKACAASNMLRIASQLIT
ncbi:MAG: aspartate-semialdehyde dehydrogenase [Gammaproteobacteria bacterium]